ncbi:MAG: nucleotidyltransferase family protein [bacterium]
MIGPVLTKVLQHAGAFDLDVVENARQLGVGPLVERLHGSSHDPRHRIACLLHHQAAKDVCAALRCDFTILKGERLGEQLYGEARLRPTSDVDILVLPKQIALVQTQLFSAGFRPRDTAVRLNVDNQQPWQHPTLPVVVELHWSIALPTCPQPPAELFVGFANNGLPTELLFVQLLYHFHNHGGFLKGLCDLAAWWDRYAQCADWPMVLRLAQNHGFTGLISWTLGVLGQMSRLEPSVAPPQGVIASFAIGWTTEAMKNCLQSHGGASHEVGMKAQETPAVRVVRQLLLAQIFDPIAPRLHATLGPVLHRLHPPEDKSRGKSHFTMRSA